MKLLLPLLVLASFILAEEAIVQNAKTDVICQTNEDCDSESKCSNAAFLYQSNLFYMLSAFSELSTVQNTHTMIGTPLYGLSRFVIAPTVPLAWGINGTYVSLNSNRNVKAWNYIAPYFALYGFVKHTVDGSSILPNLLCHALFDTFSLETNCNLFAWYSQENTLTKKEYDKLEPTETPEWLIGPKELFNAPFLPLIAIAKSIYYNDMKLKEQADIMVGFYKKNADELIDLGGSMKDTNKLQAVEIVNFNVIANIISGAVEGALKVPLVLSQGLFDTLTFGYFTDGKAMSWFTTSEESVEQEEIK